MDARIAELWRYPVKSLQGERVDEVVLQPGGVPGDRRFGVIDDESGRVLSAKTVPELLAASARTDAGDHVVVNLPDGTELAAEDPGARGALSSWLDRPVHLGRADATPEAAYEMTFDPPDDTAERFEIPTPPGSFSDLADLHLLSLESLTTLTGTDPAHAWDVRRFRPNLVVTFASPGETAEAGFPEHGWVGADLAVGGARVRVDQRTVRCAMPLRAQPGLERDVGLYRALCDRVENHLGTYATVRAAGSVGVGDPVTAA